MERVKTDLPILWLLITCLLLLAPFLCYGGAYLYSNFYWQYQQHDVVRQMKAYAYPGAIVTSEQVSIVRGMTSDWCIATAYLTFTTKADFASIKNWYDQHPKGIVYDEGGTGLDLLPTSVTDTIEYGVRYQRWIGAWFCPVTNDERKPNDRLTSTVGE